MLIEFKVANFRSFRDLTTVSMQAASKRPNDHGLDEAHVYEAAGLRMLKSKAIFGANASGKSNLVKALSAFTLMVSRSVERENLSNRIWDDRYGLAAAWEEQPVFFQGIFFLENSFYRYGFQILNGLVSYEWLFVRHTGEEKETEYLMRSPETGIRVDVDAFKGAKAFAEQAAEGNHELFRPDALFLTGAALSSAKTAMLLRNFIRGMISVDGVKDEHAVALTIGMLEKGTEEELRFIKDLLKSADTGVEDLEMADVPESYFIDKLPKRFQEIAAQTPGKASALHAVHTRYDDDGKAVAKVTVPFSRWESEGTGKLFGLSGLLLMALRDGRTLIIDEFDARFHPNLTLKIIEMFHSERTNPHHAQLIFVSHDASLLQRAELRRDQICLVNKDHYGVSTLRTVIEIKGIRKDASHEKEYLAGSYTGVPSLNGFHWAIEQIFEHDGLPETE